MEHGHRVFPSSRAASEILGVPAFGDLAEVNDTIDTVTLYVSPKQLDAAMPGILDKQPRRVIFNPGTESPSHRQRLEEAGILCYEACTLVLLTTHQF